MDERERVEFEPGVEAWMEGALWYMPMTTPELLVRGYDECYKVVARTEDERAVMREVAEKCFRARFHRFAEDGAAPGVQVSLPIEGLRTLMQND